MKTIVAYKSVSGFTKKYAEWIASELNADIVRREKINLNKLMQYDLIIYGGSLHASGIAGLSIIKNNLKKLKDKKIIIFAVGASPSRDGFVGELTQANFNDGEQKHVKLFYLRGGFNFSKLNLINKILMTLFKWKLSFKKNRSTGEENMLKSYDVPTDFTKKENIQELFNYIKKISKEK